LENGESSHIHSIAKDILGDSYDNMSDPEIIVLLLDKFKEQSTTISEFMRLRELYSRIMKHIRNFNESIDVVSYDGCVDFRENLVANIKGFVLTMNFEQ
jgi:DNA replication protein DnaD